MHRLAPISIFRGWEGAKHFCGVQRLLPNAVLSAPPRCGHAVHRGTLPPPLGLQLLPPLGRPFLSCPSFRAGELSPPPRAAAGLTSASSNSQGPRAVARCTSRWTGTAPCLLARAEPTLQSVRGESGSLNFSPCKPSRILTVSRSLLRTHQQ